MILKAIWDKIKEGSNFLKSSKTDYVNYKKDIKKFNKRYKRQSIIDNEI